MTKYGLLPILSALLWLALLALGSQLNLDVLPKPLSWTVASSGASFDLKNSFSITVDSALAFQSSNATLSLIPPTLIDFAHTFASDLRSSYSSQVSVQLSHTPPTEGIFLTLAPTSLTLADGSASPESYAISSSSKCVTVSGASPLAAFWATRTILQVGVLNDGNFPAGEVLDGPDYAIRGHMLDIGRHWYSAEVCLLGNADAESSH
jgi:hexosaminidase